MTQPCNQAFLWLVVTLLSAIQLDATMPHNHMQVRATVQSERPRGVTVWCQNAHRSTPLANVRFHRRGPLLPGNRIGAQLHPVPVPWQPIDHRVQRKKMNKHFQKKNGWKPENAERQRWCVIEGHKDDGERNRYSGWNAKQTKRH